MKLIVGVAAADSVATFTFIHGPLKPVTVYDVNTTGLTRIVFVVAVVFHEYVVAPDAVIKVELDPIQ